MDYIAGKVIFITGGAGGIGTEMIKQLLHNGAKTIVAVDISEEAGRKLVDEITQSFGKDKIVFIKADITIKKELEGAFDKAVELLNQLDIVINNAGIVDEHNWEKTVAVNLSAVIEGTYLAMKKYLPKYKSGEEGIIVNTASVCGLETVQIAPIYCVTKHGLIGLGRALGGDEFYKKYNVRILTICPGLIKTELSNSTKGLLFPEIREKEFAKLNSVAQSPIRVGEALIEVIRKGKNGSLWVTEDEEPVYEVVVPLHRNMKV